MELNFQRVSYDGDLEDADQDTLMDLVERFEDAQDENAAEFEAAKEQVEDLEGDISDFEDAKETLIEEVTEAEHFEKVPLTEDELAAADFAKVREWKEFVAEASEAEGTEEAEDGGSEEEQDFDDMGERAPTHEDGDDGPSEFAQELVSGMSGVNVDEQ